MNVDPFESAVRIVVGNTPVAEAYIPVRKIAAYIPMSRELIGPWTPDEIEQARQASERAAAKRAAEAQRLSARHAELLARYTDQPVIAALLQSHAPHENSYIECHGCPENHDYEDGSSFMDWPCPTWQTISDTTPTGSTP